jgi:hypothetical protein
MYQETFGTKEQIRFKNEHEYYELLGFLAKSNGSTSLVWEHNEEQGAWGSEGRIQFHTSNYPFAATLPYTAGVGNIAYRVNCNEFIQNLNENHGFVMGKVQPIETIKKTIPKEFLSDFDQGLNL